MGYKRGFKDPRGNLFFDIMRVAEASKPKIILLENVKNLIYHDKGKTFITIFNALSTWGYDVKYSILNACKHGNIPQQRNRIFIAAFSDCCMLDRFEFPDETELSIGVCDIIDRSVRHNDIYYYKADNKYYTELNSKIIDKTEIYRIDDSGVANKKYIISPTLKANMGTYPDRVPVIRDDYGIRKLTPYECLALQGFPKDFVFKGISLNSAYKQAGNTVCVPVVERIAEKVKEVLCETDVD
jgi:DNA (cytosine-5)-methyltransferase 1